VVADLINNETVAALAKKNTDKNAEDSGLESGHSSMNTSSDSQSDVEGYREAPSTDYSSQSPLNPKMVPDVVRTSLQARKRCDSFNMQTSQRKHLSKCNNLPVTIV